MLFGGCTWIGEARQLSFDLSSLMGESFMGSEWSCFCEATGDYNGFWLSCTNSMASSMGSLILAYWLMVLLMNGDTPGLCIFGG